MTSGVILLICPDGTVRRLRRYGDGYPENMGRALLEFTAAPGAASQDDVDELRAHFADHPIADIGDERWCYDHLYALKVSPLTGHYEAWYVTDSTWHLQRHCEVIKAQRPLTGVVHEHASWRDCSHVENLAGSGPDRLRAGRPQLPRERFNQPLVDAAAQARRAALGLPPAPSASQLAAQLREEIVALAGAHEQLRATWMDAWPHGELVYVQLDFEVWFAMSVAQAGGYLVELRRGRQITPDGQEIGEANLRPQLISS